MKNDHLWSFFNIIYTFLGSIFEPCYIQNCVIMNHVIKRLKCSCFIFFFSPSFIAYKICNPYSASLNCSRRHFLIFLFLVFKESKSLLCEFTGKKILINRMFATNFSGHFKDYWTIFTLSIQTPEQLVG